VGNQIGGDAKSCGTDFSDVESTQKIGNTKNRVITA
jgi:hypothetical protein